MTYCILDLETVRDRRISVPEPEACGASLGDGLTCHAHKKGCPCCGVAPEPFLPPVYHQIAVIGYALVDEDSLTVKTLDRSAVCATLKDEREALKETIDYLGSAEPTLVTYNGRGFDVPVLSSRAFVHGLPFPWLYNTRRGHDPVYRYATHPHLDLMEQLSHYGAAPKTKMGAWAEAMGLPGKGEVDGSDVQRLWDAREYGTIGDYVLSDVAQETALLFRWLLLSGKIPVEVYRSAVRELVGLIASRPEICPMLVTTHKDGVTKGLDLGRLYLENFGDGE